MGLDRGLGVKPYTECMLARTSSLCKYKSSEKEMVVVHMRSKRKKNKPGPSKPNENAMVFPV